MAPYATLYLHHFSFNCCNRISALFFSFIILTNFETFESRPAAKNKKDKMPLND